MEDDALSYRGGVSPVALTRMNPSSRSGPGDITMRGHDDSAARESIALKVRQWLDERPERIDGGAALRLVVDLLGRRARVYQGDLYIFEYAREQGYYLPPYPMAGSGELRRFLADQGARDIPSWYAGIGIGDELYRELAHHKLLVLMRKDYQRQAIVLDIGYPETAYDGEGAGHRAGDLARYIIDFVYGGADAARGRLYR